MLLRLSFMKNRSYADSRKAQVRAPAPEEKLHLKPGPFPRIKRREKQGKDTARAGVAGGVLHIRNSARPSQHRAYCSVAKFLDTVETLKLPCNAKLRARGF